MTRQSLEREFFRALNGVVEPAIRRGLFSPVCAPSGLIVLESTGFRTGIKRRTPLLATRWGSHVLVSTARGEKSFWVKNLEKVSSTRYFLGGNAKQATAFVMKPGKPYEKPQNLAPVLGRLTDALAPLTKRGWAFAVLTPEEFQEAIPAHESGQ